MLFATLATANVFFTSCEEEDDYIAQKLRDRDWQGTVEAYYSDRWGLSGSSYATVMHFTSKGTYYTSGRGEELDYDIRSPYSDYAYCTFKWFIVDGEITLIYDDDKWSPLYILDYGLTSSSFYGYIRDISGRRIRFDFTNADYDDWGHYGRNGSYGGFENQNWYRSRTRAEANTDVPFLDRTDIAREQSGEPDAVSVACGVFASAMQQ
jgi:hypothetical protein